MSEDTVTFNYTADQHAEMIASRLLMSAKLMMDKKGNEALSAWLYEHYGVTSPSEVPTANMAEAAVGLRTAALAE